MCSQLRSGGAAEMREWIVMLRARSSVRLTGKDILNIEARPASTEPVVAVRLRNAFAEVDGRLIFTGLIAEAGGLAEEPADAVALLSPLAAPHLQVVATAANAAVDEPSRMLIYAPPTADEPGRFLEQRSVGEPVPATTVRAIHVSDLGAVHQGLEDHSDKARLHRSMAHYRQAVQLLDPFNRVMTAQHLWMACENLGQVIFRRLCQEADLPVSDDPSRMGEHKHQLAVAAGFNPIGRSRQHLYDFDAHIRVEHILGVVPVARRDEVLAPHREHCPTQPLGAKQPATLELPDLRFALPPQVLVALDRSTGQRNEPPTGHRPKPPRRLSK